MWRTLPPFLAENSALETLFSSENSLFVHFTSLCCKCLNSEFEFLLHNHTVSLFYLWEEPRGGEEVVHVIAVDSRRRRKLGFGWRAADSEMITTQAKKTPWGGKGKRCRTGSIVIIRAAPGWCLAAGKWEGGNKSTPCRESHHDLSDQLVADWSCWTLVCRI